MIKPEYTNQKKVDSWINSHVKNFDKSLDDKELIRFGKATTSRFKRVKLNFLHAITLTLCSSPKKYYAKHGKAKLLAHNIRVTEKGFIDQKLNGKTHTQQKIAQITAKAKAKVSVLTDANAFGSNRVITFCAHAEKLETTYLNQQLSKNQAPWMTKAGFDALQRSSATKAQLKTLDAIRKVGMGDAFAEWKVKNTKEQTFEQHFHGFIKHLARNMGPSFEVRYDESLQSTPSITLLKEIAATQDSFSQFTKNFKRHGLLPQYNAYIDQSLRAGENPVALVASMKVLQENLIGVFGRYEKLDNREDVKEVDLFKLFIKERQDLFVGDGLNQAQAAFNALRLQEQLRTAPEQMKQALQQQISDEVHYLESQAGEALRLLNVIEGSPLQPLLGEIQQFPVTEIITILQPSLVFYKTCKKYGLEGVFKEKANAIFSDAHLKDLSVEDKLTLFTNLNGDLINALNRLDTVQRAHFSEKGVDTVFINAVKTAIRREVEAGNNPQDATELVCADYERLLKNSDPEARMEELCRLYVNELNTIAGSKVLFDEAFVKQFLLKRELEESLARLDMWAQFAKGKNHDQIKNFICDFDVPLFTCYVEATTDERITTLNRPLADLYDVYRERNQEQHLSLLIDYLKSSPSYTTAFTNHNLDDTVNNIEALKDLLKYAAVVVRTDVYEKEMIFEALRTHLDKSPNFHDFVRNFGDRNGKDALYKTIFTVFIRTHAAIGLGKQGAELFVDQLANLFTLSAFPKRENLDYVQAIAKKAGTWYLNGSRRIDILNQLLAAKDRTIEFEVNKIKPADIKDLKEISLVAIDGDLERLRHMKTGSRGVGSSTASIFELAVNNPEKILTALAPAFIEPLLQDTKDKAKVRDLKSRLAALEPQMAKLDFIKTLGALFTDNREAVMILSLLPPEETRNLANEVLDALYLHAQSRKKTEEPSRSSNATTFLATNMLEVIVQLIVQKFSDARNTNVGKLPMPEKQEFYDNFPDVKAVTDHWAYKHGLRFAPKLLNIVGRSGAIGEKLMQIPLSLYIKRHAKNMSEEEQEALIKSLGPIIEVCSLAVSSFLQRHEVDHYFNFLQELSDYLHTDTMTTAEDKAVFKLKVWTFMDRLLHDLKDYPQAGEQLLRAISDMAAVR